MATVTIDNPDTRLFVLRDDLLPGGTKSVVLPALLPRGVSEVVYASPVYGGFQIAIAEYCKAHGLKATIFSAKRAVMHANTKRAKAAGARIVQVPYGYLSNVEAKAAAYSEASVGRFKIAFGGAMPEARMMLEARVRAVIKRLKARPDAIYCAVGSGTLVEAILAATDNCVVHGVVVGRDYANPHPRLRLHQYPRPFDWECKAGAPFPSMPNYDLKAWEVCIAERPRTGITLFWNVL